MGCREKTKRFVRRAWSVLGPVLAPHVAATVGIVEDIAQSIPDLMGGHEKRKAVIGSTMRKARDIGHDAFNDARDVTVSELEGAIRAAIQNAVFHMDSGDDWSELTDTSDVQPDDSVPVT